MQVAFRAVGRLGLLAALFGGILFLAVVSEVVIEALTVNRRDLRHLLVHAMGNVGAMMIVFSVAGYMLKRRYPSFPGRLADWLYVHRRFAVIGAALATGHTAARLGAFIPAVTFMLLILCTFSGFVGLYVYNRAVRELSDKRKELAGQGFPPEAVEERVAVAAAATGLLSRWRSFHLPAAGLLLAFTVLHAFAALYFGG